MKKKIVPITDLVITRAKPKDKDYKLSDGKGLYCLITTTGAKYWRLNYSFDDKNKTLALGVYPETTLKGARDKRTAARELLAKGVDPSAVKKEIVLQKKIDAETFKSVALEWHAKNIEQNKTAEYSRRVKRQLEEFIFCAIGDKKLADITTPMLYKLLLAISEHSNYTAHRLKGIIIAIYAYAIVTDKAASNPAISLQGVLPTLEHKHFPAPTTPKALTPVLKAIDEYNNGYFALKVALQILPHVMIRPGNLQKAEWTQIHFDDALWIIPTDKMKKRKEHIVPLSNQVFKLLKEIHTITGNGRYIFPSMKSADKPISHNSFNEAFRYMGFSGDVIVAHGLRATARTMLQERLDVNPEVIEKQLAHTVPDRLGDAYNRSQFMAQRKVTMQLWSDFLDTLKRS